MAPKSMSWSEPPEVKANPFAGLPHSDLAVALRQRVQEGMSPELALDVVLNEVVVRAADATGASAAALALAREGEMVCRASTGLHAPGLGIRLNTRDGLSGECLRTREPQLCLDTETDERVDAEACRRLGIRSMLIVPILDKDDLIGVIEVFSPDPDTFSPSHDMLLESFARTCTRLRHLAAEVEKEIPVAKLDESPAEGPQLVLSTPTFLPKTHSATDIWALVLGGLAIVSAVAFSFMIGSRVGWLGSPESNVPLATNAASTDSSRKEGDSPATGKKSSSPQQRNSKSANTTNASPPSNALVVYEQGKEVFRVKPSPRSGEKNLEGTTSAEPAVVWLAPDVAESRLRQRVEPQYPPEARDAHRAGDVVLEIRVGTDGGVTSVRTLNGDPLLADAAMAAVREWHYEPYRLQGALAEFQTDVTLKFALPQ